MKFNYQFVFIVIYNFYVFVIIYNPTMQKNIFRIREDETVYISSEGLQKLLKTYNPKQGPQNILWTTDYKTELPIKLKKTGIASEQPVTLIEEFQRVVRQSPNLPALSQKINNKWVTLNYQQYFQECINFGKALVELGLNFNAINIIGFNAPEWHISFFGSLFARCLPVGIYTTNSAGSCHYIATHSQCKLIVSQTQQLAKKYFDLLQKGEIKYIVIYKKNQKITNNYDGRIMLWKDFLLRGKRVQRKTLEDRMKSVRPGNCCTLVYTSGTTGMPKGVMLSHDNYTWVKKSAQLRTLKKNIEPFTMVTYLPLSHVAAQFQDITGAMQLKSHVFFAQPDALQGSLIKTLLQVRPTIFFSVPRVWQKIQEKIKEKAANNSWFAKKLGSWAKQIGAEGTIQEQQRKQTSFQFNLAKKLVYNKVREAIGLQRAEYLVFGAAPLAPETRQFFLSLNIYLMNAYGMSQCSGPQNISEGHLFKNDKTYMRQAGTAMQGTQLKIVPLNPGEQQGEICYRGRHIFMGYYKNPEETAKTIDDDSFLHSGDIGKVDKEGILFITGRLKQLLITAAGENIPPVLIENQIKEQNTHISNIMLIGDDKKFLSALVTLKTQPNGQLWDLQYYKNLGSKSTNLESAKSDPIIFNAIKQSIEKYNEKAISRAQRVQTFALLGEDFTVENGLLTPTLKLKRKQVLKKFDSIIEGFYRQAKL